MTILDELSKRQPPLLDVPDFAMIYVAQFPAGFVVTMSALRLLVFSLQERGYRN